MSQIPEWPIPTTPEISYQSQTGSGIPLNVEGVDALRRTRPWVLFLAVLAFIFGGFAVIAGIAMVGLAFAEQRDELFALGIVYVLGSLLYLLIGYWMIRYSGAINSFLRFGTPEKLAAAIIAQKNYWRGIGIMAIVVIILYFAGIAIVFVSLTMFRARI